MSEPLTYRGVPVVFDLGMPPPTEPCPLCGYAECPAGDRYGCPNCHGEGLDDA